LTSGAVAPSRIAADPPIPGPPPATAVTATAGNAAVTIAGTAATSRGPRADGQQGIDRISRAE